jgi:hypothetical protein
MLANEKSLEHSHIIIAELIKTILDEVQLPLTLAKLEGDAVFLYAVKDESFAERAADLGARVLRFFHVFANKVAELTLSSFCKCGACTNIEQLKLKVVVHSGRCAFYPIANLTELSGVDVIIVHRLLKNSVRMSEYVLLTQAAQQTALPEEVHDGIGSVPTYVYSSPAGASILPHPRRRASKRFAARQVSTPRSRRIRRRFTHTGQTAALLGYGDELPEGIPEESVTPAGTGNPFASAHCIRRDGRSSRAPARTPTPGMVGRLGRCDRHDAGDADEARGRLMIRDERRFIWLHRDIPLRCVQDVIISNGVINQAPKRAFLEMHRVRKTMAGRRSRHHRRRRCRSRRNATSIYGR